MKTTLLSIVIFCCLQPAVFADTNAGRSPAATSGAKRIIGFSPAITEILFAVGAGDSIVGVSDFCNYPAAALKKQKVGGAVNPCFERLLFLKPDLLILQGRMEKIRRFCKKYSIPIHEVTLDDWATITNGMQQIGNMCGKKRNAEELRERLARRWDAVRMKKQARNPVTAFICLVREPGPVASCMTAGRASFITEALAVAGGSNVCDDVVGSYPTISAEVLLARKPVVFFDMRPGVAIGVKERKRLLRDWSSLGSVPAVMNGRVVVLSNDFITIPGPRIVDLVELFSRAVLYESQQK